MADLKLVSQTFMQGLSQSDAPSANTKNCNASNKGKFVDYDALFTELTLDLDWKQLASICSDDERECSEHIVKNARYKSTRWPWWCVANALGKRPDILMKIYARLSGIDMANPALEALFVMVRKLFASQTTKPNTTGSKDKDVTVLSGGAGVVAHTPASIRGDAP